MAKYRKVDPRIWNDEKFRALSDDGKLVFLFLLTHPHMTSLGAMRETVPGMAAELGWSEKAFRKAFMEGCSARMVQCNENACFVWLPRFLKYNRPESPNVIKSWGDAWELVPECNEKHELYQHLKGFTKGLTKGFREGWSAVESALADHPLPIQEQEQEQDKRVSSYEDTSVPAARRQSEFSFSLVGGNLWDLPQRKLDEYLGTYNGLDVPAELRKAKQWLLDNPDKRKRSTGMKRFLTGWLNRACDRKPLNQGGRPTPGPGQELTLNPETGEYYLVEIGQ